jgi:hypothetical protein
VRKESASLETTRSGTSLQPSSRFQANPFYGDIRLLLLAALIVFIVTAAIGLFNGQHIVTLSQDVVLTHVHSGTIGWITLGIFAISLWFFGQNETREAHPFMHWTSVIAAVAVPVYVLAFLSGNYLARAIFGFPVLYVMAVFLGWIAMKSRQIRPGVPHIALLASLLTLVLGGLLGVLLQIQYATNVSFLPNGAFAAHPATLVAGYLVLIGMALSDWHFRPGGQKLPRAGVAQIVLLFLAGIALGLGLLLSLNPLFGLSSLSLLIGGIIYLVRLAPRVLRSNWSGGSSDPLFIASAVFILLNIVMTLYITVQIIRGVFPNGEAPAGLLIALDHTTFVGIMTNALFGLLHEATTERRAFWPWANQALFWATNIGLIGFIISLLSGIRVLENIFTPIMGLGILLGIVVYIVRLLPGRAAGVPFIETPVRSEASSD